MATFGLVLLRRLVFPRSKPEDLALENGLLFVKGDGAPNGVPFADLLRRADLRLVNGSGDAPATFRNPKAKFSTYSYGCHFAEVTWQPEIARLRVRRVVTVIDAGRILNTLAGRNEIQGAVVMGIGMALLEHTSYDPQNGAPINSSMADYIVAVNADAPPIEVHFLDFPYKEINELGARGIGEIGLAGIAASHHGRGAPRNRCSCARTAGEDRKFVGVIHTGKAGLAPNETRSQRFPQMLGGTFQNSVTRTAFLE